MKHHTPHKRNLARFPVVSVPKGDGTVRAYQIECSCGTQGHVTFPRKAVDPESVAKAFKRKGWIIRRHAGSHQCPGCVAGRARSAEVRAGA